MAEESVMRRVQALLDRANHQDTPQAERESCMAKAEALMYKHSVDEAMLRMRQDGISKKDEPIKSTVDFIPKDDAHWRKMCEVPIEFARLSGVRLCWEGSRTLAIVGFESDVKYFEMLWMSAYMTYTRKLFPQWDTSRTLAQNIRAQKEAGVKWPEIYDTAVFNGWVPMRRKGHVDIGEPSVTPDAATASYEKWSDSVRVGRCPNDSGYFKRLYEKQCKADGVEPTNHTQRNADYRESYLWSFVDEVAQRARRMFWKREEQRHVGRPGKALALASTEQAVRDKYNELYPPGEVRMLDSHPERQGSIERNAAQLGAMAGQSVDLSGGRGYVTKDAEQKALG